MNDIIFTDIIEKVSLTSDNINNYFRNADYYNTNIYDIFTKLPAYNIIIYLFIIFIVFFIINKFTIRLNEILFFLISTLLIYFFIKKDYSEFIKFTNNKNLQLEFLHKLMFNSRFIDDANLLNNTIRPKDKTNLSYLYLNPLIVQFYYDIRTLLRYNSSAYIKSILHINNLLALNYESKYGLNRTYLNFETAIIESQSALNELNSVIYKIPSTIVNYKKYNDSLKLLHSLIFEILKDTSDIFKNDNKTQELNNYRMPDSFYETFFDIQPNNTKDMGYISTFNFY